MIGTNPASVTPQWTCKQGQYLAFIHLYTLINGQPPAQRDIQHFFNVTPPTVHRMILELEKKGFLTKAPRRPRSLKVTVPPEHLPRLQKKKLNA